MADSRFVYVIYIRSTPEKLWRALIEPEFTRRFWCKTYQESEWKPGASWRVMTPDGRRQRQNPRNRSSAAARPHLAQ